MRLRPWEIAVLVFTGLLLLGLSVARADEDPCKPVGSTVVCDRAGFEILVKKLIDSDADAKRTKVLLDAKTADYEEAQTALTDCLDIPKVPPVPVPKELAVGPMVLGIAGGLVAGALAVVDTSATVRATGVVVGSALVGAGILWLTW